MKTAFTLKEIREEAVKEIKESNSRFASLYAELAIQYLQIQAKRGGARASAYCPLFCVEDFKTILEATGYYIKHYNHNYYIISIEPIE